MQDKIQEFVLNGHTGVVKCIEITNDNQYIISGGADMILRIWSLKDRIQVAVLQGHTNWIRFAAIANDNKYIISGSEDKEIRFWTFLN